MIIGIIMVYGIVKATQLPLFRFIIIMVSITMSNYDNWDIYGIWYSKSLKTPTVQIYFNYGQHYNVQLW